AIEGAGGRSNAFTAHEVTCYLAKVPYEKADLAMDVIADMVQHSLLAPEEVERERKVVIEEIRRTWDHPGAWAGELVFRAAFGDQPLGWSIAGTEDSVNGLSRDDLAGYVANWYVPNNLVVSVAGNVRHQQVLDLVDRYVSDVPARQIESYAAAQPRVASQPVIVETRAITQANLVMVLRGPGRKDPRRYIFTILSNLLGSGMSSRLFKEVRERRGLAYSVGCGVIRFQDVGALTASAGVSPENVVQTTEVMLAEFRKLATEAVGEEELTKARDYSVGNFRLGLEDSMSVARWVGESLMTTGEVQDVKNVVSQLRGVTAADLQRLAGELFVGNDLSIALTGPNDESSALEALASNWRNN
ncbi:MAG: pitrilysin family protein, partial [Chloroflexota bacterium]